MRMPGTLPEGTVSELLFGVLDMPSTLLGLMGFDAPDNWQGKNLAPAILSGDDDAVGRHHDPLVDPGLRRSRLHDGHRQPAGRDEIGGCTVRGHVVQDDDRAGRLVPGAAQGRGAQLDLSPRPARSSAGQVHLADALAAALADHPQHPGFEVDEEAIYITANYFVHPGDFSGGADSFVWIVDKHNFYEGGATTANVYSPAGETGLFNLTQDQAPVLVHFGPEEPQTALLVRLDESERPESGE